MGERHLYPDLKLKFYQNFAMTDFASQGKTRPQNPVDLNNCRSHQAYYTALSRSSTAKGTIILQGFEPKKITGRASGALRQELHNFRLHKGMSYVPNTVYCAIKC